MPNNYPFKPRGIMKWHAFSALIDGEDQKDDVVEITDLNIDLTTNQYSLLNYNLSYAVAMNCKVTIEYIKNNKKHKLIGYIDKVDEFNQVLSIDQQIIHVKDIFNIII